jgi:hypothetical protein
LALERDRHRTISLDVASEFSSPEFDVGLRNGSRWTRGVSVPKASVHEDGEPLGAIGEIRIARKVSIAHTKPEAE